MTIKEKHIQVEQGIQHIAANKSRGLYPEEIDIIINKMINRYVISRLRPKPDGSFEMDQLAAEQLKTLLVRKSLSAEINGTDYISLLPSDLGWFISSGADIVNTVCAPAPIQQRQGTIFIHKLVLPTSAKSTGPYYETASISGPVGGATLAEIAAAQGVTWAGVPAKEQKFSVYPFLVQQLRLNSSYQVYVNRSPYGSLATDGQYTLYIISPGNDVISAVVDGGSAVNSTVTGRAYKVHTNTPTAKVPIRLKHSVDAFKMTADPYYGPTVHSPTAQIRGNLLHIDGSSSYIVIQSDVIYLKKPRLVSLSLGLNSDLPEDFHGEIVDSAITYIKTLFNSPDWEKLLADLKMNTTLNP